MELEKMNEDYVEQKNKGKKSEKLKEEISKIKEELKPLKREREDLIITRTRANEDGDKSVVEDCDKKLKENDEKVKMLLEKSRKMQSFLDKSQENVDKHIEELSKNPEIRQHLDNVLKKKFGRKIEKISKEGAYLENIKKLLQEHPTFKKNIIGVKNAQQEIEKLNEEKSKLDPMIGKTRIGVINSLLSKAQEKYSNNKESITSYIKNNGIDIPEEKLEEFLNGNFKMKTIKEKGGTEKREFDIDGTLNNHIKGNRKSLENYQIAFSRLSETEKTIETKLNNTSKSGVKQTIEESNVEFEGANLPAKQEKPKWYQFRKRFLNWRNSKKEIETDTEKQSISRKDMEKEIDKDSKSEFKDFLKYDIVKDYKEMYEKQVLEEAKNEKKEAKSGKKEFEDIKSDSSRDEEDDAR